MNRHGCINPTLGAQCAALNNRLSLNPRMNWSQIGSVVGDLDFGARV
jgi:hypothetical protein